MEFLKVLPIEIKRFLSKLNDSSPKFKGIKPLKGAKVTIAFPRRGCTEGKAFVLYSCVRADL